MITETDRRINEEAPWKLAGDPLQSSLDYYAHQLQRIAINLQPFMPETAEKILKQFTGKITASEPLFPRI